MNMLKNIFLAAALCCMTACEKEIISEEAPAPDEETPAASTSALTALQKSQALSIAEAQTIADGNQVCIRAYIVASTTRSIANADFEAPFAGSSAIVLADSPTTEAADGYDAGQLMPVCLTDRKQARTALNLEDNPTNWNRLIYIIGTREKYMSMAGLKKVELFEMGE